MNDKRQDAVEWIQKQIPENMLPRIMHELPKAEAAGTPKKMYEVLNHHLACAAYIMDYPARQWEWPDSEPLEVMSEIYQGIEPSQWYQSQLTETIMPSQSPLLALPILD